ncbi:MAG: hypothetical protein JW915_01090 [Chitinispirillaceae bacterium]|nr:hypothetical protein [Chitinispirillaceae bacterium]
MNETLYTDKLNWFKQNEKPETLLMIADNPELIKIVIAWSNCQVKPAVQLTVLSCNSENEIWDWLWENTRFSLTKLKVTIGVPYSESVLEQKLKPLIGNRILYPDGTVNSFVQRYLRSEVARLFEIKSRKAIKKTPGN